MAKWSGNKVNPEQINNGNEYSVNDNLSVEAINGIVNNSINAQKNADEALKKANSAYEANGTLVKINGVNQTTWDATFSQKLYEESKNEFNINSKEIVWGQYWVDGINASGFANSFYSIQEIKPNTTYAISFKNEINPSRYAYNILDTNKNPISWKYDSTARTSKEWTFTTESNARYIVISQLDTSKENISNLSIQLEKGNVATSIEKYNPNRHITNPQAEFLKDECDKSKNLFNGNLSQKVYVYSTGELTGGGANYVCSTDKISVSPNQSITLSTSTNINVSESGFVFFNSGKYVGYAKGVLTTTVPANANQVVFNLYTNDGLIPSSYVNVQLEYGNVATSYQLYNSSSHITNPQADFLKNQHNKQLNIANITQLLEQPQGMTCSASKNHIIIRGTGTNNFGIEFGDTVKLKPNTTYTAKIFNQVGTMDDVIYLWDYDKVVSYGGAYLGVLNSHYTFTTPNEVGNNIKLDVYYETAQGNIDIEFDYMLVEGPDIPEEFETYQGGEFAQIGDITSIVLYENGNPNIAFDSQPITFSTDDYVRGVCFCKRTKDDINLISVEFLKGYGFLVSNAHTQSGVGADNYERVFSRNSDTSFNVGNCWHGAGSSETASNDYLIPVKILGFKY